MTSETVTYSLESVLTRIESKIDNLQKDVDRKFDTLQKDVDQKFDTLQKDVDQKFDTLQKDLTDVKVGLATLTEKVGGIDDRLKAVEGTQKNQIWTLITLLGGSLIAVGFKAFFMGNNP
jgi:septal ring factor EnvC (AmiA/AmiB activator)